MKKQKNNVFLLDSPLTIGIVLAILIVLCFLFLSPKISSTLFPWKRQQIWQTFLTSIKTHNAIDPQDYWKFREFYSPGSYQVNKVQGFAPSSMQQLTKLPLHTNTLGFIFSQFTSPHLVSFDSLIINPSLSRIIDQPSIQNKPIIFHNTTSLMYYDSPKVVKLIFIMTKKQMETANGFLDYTEGDKELSKNKYWLNTTTIELD